MVLNLMRWLNWSLLGVISGTTEILGGSDKIQGCRESFKDFTKVKISFRAMAGDVVNTNSELLPKIAVRVQLPLERGFLRDKSLKFMILTWTKWMLWIKFSRESFPWVLSFNFQLFGIQQDPILLPGLITALSVKGCAAVREPLHNFVPQD